MKNLTKSLLATLMLMGFSFTANAGSCGESGNPGGLSFGACIQQEFLTNGKRIFNKNLEVGFVRKVFQTNNLEDGIKKIERMAKATISTLESHNEINKAKFDLRSVIMYIRTLSIEEIRRKASLYNTASL
jgi:hypothetical protein